MKRTQYFLLVTVTVFGVMLANGISSLVVDTDSAMAQGRKSRTIGEDFTGNITAGAITLIDDQNRKRAVLSSSARDGWVQLEFNDTLEQRKMILYVDGSGVPAIGFLDHGEYDFVITADTWPGRKPSLPPLVFDGNPTGTTGEYFDNDTITANQDRLRILIEILERELKKTIDRVNLIS